MSKMHWYSFTKEKIWISNRFSLPPNNTRWFTVNVWCRSLEHFPYQDINTIILSLSIMDYYSLFSNTNFLVKREIKSKLLKFLTCLKCRRAELNAAAALSCHLKTLDSFSTRAFFKVTAGYETWIIFCCKRRKSQAGNMEVTGSFLLIYFKVISWFWTGTLFNQST